jgi:hypothetical protein
MVGLLAVSDCKVAAGAAAGFSSPLLRPNNQLHNFIHFEVVMMILPFVDTISRWA